ncbi:Hypothetical predicted protein [Podarcis lilfordi]|uniref:Uncharacterized protein n=1 Tax=Podarcis lilfordi TaxID=74358 RepID=A0AA35P9M5_9SAUR|nr:Hypothetical predicted protein [Podarcis lilfordi]
MDLHNSFNGLERNPCSTSLTRFPLSRIQRRGKGFEETSPAEAVPHSMLQGNNLCFGQSVAGGRMPGQAPPTI